MIRKISNTPNTHNKHPKRRIKRVNQTNYLQVIKIKLKKIEKQHLADEILDFIAKQKKKQTYNSVLEYFTINYESTNGIEKIVPVMLTKLENKGMLQLDQKK